MPARQLTFFPPPRPLVERLGAEFFRAVPERPGVYLLCGAREGILYVGKAKNLRRRLGSYRFANLDGLPRKLRRLLASVERIHWDECADEASALARERELLLALRPRFNTVGVFAAPQLHLGWQHTDTGLALGCGEATEGWAERHGPVAAGRYLHGALARLLWWTLHPSCGWNEMPLTLRGVKVAGLWKFAVEPEAAEETSVRLADFFRGDSPELVEWGVWSASRRPRFERAWIERDALWLLDYYEKLIGPVDEPADLH